MKAILCPEPDGSYTLDLFTGTGSWVITLNNAFRSFEEDFRMQTATIPRSEIPAGWEGEVLAQIAKANRQI
jgi:hypothetical protein